MATPLTEIQCFVFDMDGTIYLGESLIDGAKDLLFLLREKGIPFFFFTNNSSKDPEEYAKKLERLGIPAEKKDILTSGHVMLHYLKSKGYDAVYLAGTPALEQQFVAAGIQLLPADAKEAKAVVLGFDTTLTYEKLDALCRLIAGGAEFLATNMDRVCPLAGGAFLPDCGSMAQAVFHATGVSPKFTGKPAKETVDFILSMAGAPAEKVAMVGDRLYTDIATAVNGGCMGIAVLSGEISMRDIEESEIQPDYIFNCVGDMKEALQ